MRRVIAICVLIGVGVLFNNNTTFAQQGRAISENIELLGKIAPSELSTLEFNYNDIWGYAADGREYAIMGARNGTWFIEVTDPAVPRVVHFHEGSTSLWRDIKTHAHYAYVVHELENSNRPGNGIEIFDLSSLPESVEHIDDVNIAMPTGTAHNLYIENGLAYLAGVSQGTSVVIVDLANPRAPELRTTVNLEYWHDVVVNNGVMFGSELESGIRLMDVSDLDNITTISRTVYPRLFTHNLWPTADNQFMVGTDERFGLPVRFWDISDLEHPVQVAQYNVGERSLAHNAHVLGDYAYVSFYYDGLKIFDISDRSAPSEVAWYNTFAEGSPGLRQGFDGAWGVYPNLPSGNILVSDMTFGLSILAFENVVAGTLEGQIRDAGSQELIPNVTVTVLEQSGAAGQMVLDSRADGSYHLTQRPGTFGLRFFKEGYQPRTIQNIEIIAGETQSLDVELEELQLGAVRLIIENASQERLPGVELSVESDIPELEFEASSNSAGIIPRSMPFGTYSATFWEWGYALFDEKFEVDQAEPIDILLVAKPAYFHDFNSTAGWQSRQSDRGGRWTRALAGSHAPSSPFPNVDFNGNPNQMYAKAEVNDGEANVTTHDFDATQMDDPVLRFYRWYDAPDYQTNSDADDKLQVWLHVDGEEILLDEYANVQDREWKLMEYHLDEFAESAERMSVRFSLIEGPQNSGSTPNTRVAVYAAIDEFLVADADFDVVSSVSNTSAPIAQPAMFSIFPNPANNVLQVTPHVPFPGAGNSMRILDLRGRTVLQQNFSAALGVAFDLDLTGLPEGIYFVRLQAQDGRSQSLPLSLIR